MYETDELSEEIEDKELINLIYEITEQSEPDLYEKTIECGSLPDNGSLLIKHKINNLDLKKIKSISGFAKNPSGKFIEIPDAKELELSVYIYIDKTYVSIITTKDFSEYTESYVTIRYYK